MHAELIYLALVGSICLGILYKFAVPVLKMEVQGRKEFIEASIFSVQETLLQVEQTYKMLLQKEKQTAERTSALLAGVDGILQEHIARIASDHKEQLARYRKIFEAKYLASLQEKAMESIKKEAIDQILQAVKSALKAGSGNTDQSVLQLSKAYISFVSAA